MPKLVKTGYAPGQAALDVANTDSGAALRVSAGSSGNAIEVYNGGTVLWSVDNAGNPSAGGGGGGGNVTLLPTPTGVDDTSAINAVLALGGNVAGRPGAAYKISSALVIPSNTNLDMSSCSITLIAGSNTNMLVNAAYQAGSGRNNNISIKGGTWARGANTGTNMGLDSIIMQRVDQLQITDLSITSSAGKYSVHIYACTRFEVGRLTLAVASDGVHMNSGCVGGYVHDIYGTTGDDVVAITSVDFAAHQNGDFGAVTDIHIANIFATATVGCGVKLLAGFDGSVARNVERIWVKNVSGSFTNTAVFLGGDSSNASTVGGSILNVEVDGVFNSAGGGSGCVYFYGEGAGQIIDGVTIKRAYSTTTSAVNFYSAGVVNPIGTVTIKDSYFATGISANSNGANTVTIKQLVIEDCHFNVAAGVYAVAVTGTNTTVESISVKNCLIEHATNSGGTVQVLGTTNTVRDIFLSDITINQNAWSIGDFGGSATINLYAVNINNRGGGGNIINLRAGATLNVKRLDGIVGGTTIANAGTLNWNGYSLNGTTTTTAPGAGGAGALPATPAGYVTVAIDGTNRQIAYY